MAVDTEDVMLVKVEVNGKPLELPAEGDDTAVELVRERLGLTGTKLVCGAGVCGACTVLLDGEPVASCLLPTAAVHGRRLVTVEGIAEQAHPVTRAFVAHGAMQCGFCTPGFVVEAAAFHDRWRAERGNVEPTVVEVAAELAGHLCRCGAYAEIYAAVQAACAGYFDEAITVAGPRLEAPAKVAGTARYTVDVHHDGQLEGVIVRSPHAHARVLSVDVSGALAVDGVTAAVELVPADRVVRYLGQEVAAVAAADRRAAEVAATRVTVTYEPLLAVIGADAARAPDAPLVYSKRRRNPPNTSEGPSFPAPWKGNVRGPLGSFSTGKRRARRRLDAARAAGDPLLVEAVFSTEAQSHTSFEPHAAVARYVGDTLEVHVSTQAVAAVAALIADRFGLSPQKVRVIAEHVGGGFGAKLGLSPETVAAITLAGAAKAPVRVVLDRAEELSFTGYRPAARIEVALLANRQADLRALRMAAYADAGVGVGSSIAALARLIYPVNAKELLDYDVVNNVSPGSPFRGPGGALTSFALEQTVDEAACRLGADPIALRQRWDPDPLRQRLYGWASAQPAWRNRPDLPRDGRFRRGIGVAAVNWFYWWEPGSTVELSVERGRLVVSTGVQDMGTGSRSVLARAVAEAFGLRPTDVEVRLGDSTLPRGPVSGGSRTTATIVPAAMDAAERLKAKLGGEAGGAPWSEILAGAHGTRVTSARPRDDRQQARGATRAFGGGGAIGASFGAIMRLMGHVQTGRGYTGAVHLAEVEVDTRLGRTRVLRVIGGLAVGRLAAPELALAQARGAVIQGVGYALYEQRVLDPDTGLVLTAGLEDYRIPGIADVPEIELHFEPGGFEHVQGKGVGLGEISTLPVAAAIANAVHDATGVRPYALPIRPDRLLAGLAERGVK